MRCSSLIVIIMMFRHILISLLCVCVHDFKIFFSYSQMKSSKVGVKKAATTKRTRVRLAASSLEGVPAVAQGPVVAAKVGPAAGVALAAEAEAEVGPAAAVRAGAGHAAEVRARADHAAVAAAGAAVAASVEAGRAARVRVRKKTRMSVQSLVQTLVVLTASEQCGLDNANTSLYICNLDVRHIHKGSAFGSGTSPYMCVFSKRHYFRYLIMYVSGSEHSQRVCM